MQGIAPEIHTLYKDKHLILLKRSDQIYSILQ